MAVGIKLSGLINKTTAKMINNMEATKENQILFFMLYKSLLSSNNIRITPSKILSF